MCAEIELSDSLENYLEAIYQVVSRKKAARAKDIARRLAVSSSSVTAALQALGEKGLVNYAPYDIVTLTEDGTKRASEIVRRHTTLRRFLMDLLAIDPAEAEEAACVMEHALTNEAISRLGRFMKAIENCPRANTPWIRDLKEKCADEPDPKRCGECVARCLEHVSGGDAGEAADD